MSFLSGLEDSPRDGVRDHIIRADQSANATVQFETVVGRFKPETLKALKQHHEIQEYLTTIIMQGDQEEKRLAREYLVSRFGELDFKLLYDGSLALDSYGVDKLNEEEQKADSYYLKKVIEPILEETKAPSVDELAKMHREVRDVFFEHFLPKKGEDKTSNSV